jgi:hypothetical protein
MKWKPRDELQGGDRLQPGVGLEVAGAERRTHGRPEDNKCTFADAPMYGDGYGVESCDYVVVVRRHRNDAAEIADLGFAGPAVADIRNEMLAFGRAFR